MVTQTSEPVSVGDRPASMPVPAERRPMPLQGRVTPRAADLATRVRGGIPVASFQDYADAETAIDVLAEADLPVEQMAIVGCDVRLIEDARVLERGSGRTTWGRAATYGAIAGAWLGGLVGIILAVVASTGTVSFVAALLWAVILGALVGAPAGLAGALSVQRARGTISGQRLLAGRYDLYAPPDGADEVRSVLLRRRPSGTRLVDGVA